ncbi:MAG: hypothetical protein WAM60_13280 [Candidatus Promineifilaceae bacterium]
MHSLNNNMNTEQLEADLQQIIKQQTVLQTADPQSLLEAALTAYHNARIDGLCHEGAWEVALQTLSTSP